MSDRIPRIRAALQRHLDTDEIQIRDESHLHAGHAGAQTGLGHFHVTIRSTAFDGLTPIKRHRLIYEAMGDLMQTDVHALSIRALGSQE